MNQAITEVDIPVANTNLGTFFAAAYLLLFQWVFSPFRHLWTQYYQRVVTGGQGVAMSQSALAFIINALLALAGIKSQNLPGFPFQTHPLAIMVSVTCLLMYGLASVAELVVFSAGLDPMSVCAVTAHVGKIVSLCILVASLASLFYM